MWCGVRRLRVVWCLDSVWTAGEFAQLSINQVNLRFVEKSLKMASALESYVNSILIV